VIVADLSGAELDYWVAKAEGMFDGPGVDCYKGDYSPSSDDTGI